VLVVLDDFSTDLLQTMRSAREMRARGAWYPHAYVVDSLCCVSRASTFTGQYPHQTGVLTNVANRSDPADPRGGWPAFAKHGNRERTVAVRLQRAGYTTGYVGKYLNQYEYSRGGPLPPTIPGWDDLRVVFGSAYDGWDFWSTRLVGGRMTVRHHPAPPPESPSLVKDVFYAGTVIDVEALDFIADHEDDKAPYFLQVAPYAPHSRVNPRPHYVGDPFFPPAYRDRPQPGLPSGNCGAVSCASLTLRDLPGYGDPQRDNRPRRFDGNPAPAWNKNPRGPRPAVAMRALRNRARMAQSADRMASRILDAVGPDTYVILTSDNGFHLGQQGLAHGKGTAYTTDTRVPLLVVGPGVEPGRRRELVSNLDLATTLERLAGLAPAPYRSGTSLLPSLADPAARDRDYVFFEHTWTPAADGDPDRATGSELEVIPSYVAVRTRSRLLVRLDLDRGPGTSYAWEFYDLSTIGYERRNDYARARYRDEVRLLQGKLKEFDACSSATRDQPVPARCRALVEGRGQ
jgi:N-acetylglucosamine-6-sulfatase